jgi:hypothetical protein
MNLNLNLNLNMEGLGGPSKLANFNFSRENVFALCESADHVLTTVHRNILVNPELRPRQWPSS